MPQKGIINQSSHRRIWKCVGTKKPESKAWQNILAFPVQFLYNKTSGRRFFVFYYVARTDLNRLSDYDVVQSGLPTLVEAQISSVDENCLQSMLSWSMLLASFRPEMLGTTLYNLLTQIAIISLTCPAEHVVVVANLCKGLSIITITMINSLKTIY